MEEIFDMILDKIISNIISFILGGGCMFFICKKYMMKSNQKIINKGDNSSNVQIGNINNGDSELRK